MGHTSIMTERYLAPGQGAYAQDGINVTFSSVVNMPILTAAAAIAGPQQPGT
jgi:hypothetical protein